MKKQDDMTIDDALLTRYLTGEATPEEAMALQDWLAQPGHQAQYDALASVWQQAQPAKAYRQPDAAKAWKAVAPAVPLTHAQQPTRWWRTAAAVAAVMLVATAWLVWRGHGPTTIAERTAVSGTMPHAVALADQSEVTLFHHSELVYPEQFGGDRREVRLVRGEAFFKIAKDADHPFIVQTALGNIQVVGTAFNVRMMDQQLELSVQEGKVQVSAGNQQEYVSAGQTARLKANQTIEILDAVDVNVWGYVTKKLTYNNTPVRQVLEDIAHLHHVTVQVSDSSIYNCPLTATFGLDSAEKLLDLVAESLNLTVVKDGAVFTLQGEGCH